MSGTRPNVVLLLTDDQRFDQVAQMATVSALRARLFTNAFVTEPLCCPSRASILTGQYPEHHGVLTNYLPRGSYERFQDKDTLVTRLQAAGTPRR